MTRFVILVTAEGRERYWLPKETDLYETRTQELADAGAWFTNEWSE